MNNEYEYLKDIEDEETKESDIDYYLDDSVKLYLKSIAEYPLLTAEEERGLLIAAQSGDKDAKQKLIESNLRLVVFIAKKYYKKDRNLDFLDLVQEGTLGLMTAIDKFDVSTGNKLSTYAYFWCTQRITRALEDKEKTIRIPVHTGEQISKQYKVSKDLEQKLGRIPTLEELADAMGTSVEKVSEIINVAQTPISIDTPVGEDENCTIGDIVPDKDAASPESIVTNATLYSSIKEAMDNILLPKEAAMLSMRFGLDDGEAKTLEEIGNVYGVTRERSRQICDRALAKLKYKASYLADYFAA